MKRITLGADGPEVSELCLGTMTFSNQTDQAEAFKQMDRALDAGITFLDCAEMYPVNPVKVETAGQSEQVIGAWLAERGHRDRIEVATKAVGPGSSVRAGKGYTPENLASRVDDSLKRLGVETIDLYQYHWPTRGSYHFRQYWNYDPSSQRKDKNLAEIDSLLDEMERLTKAGKVRAWGLSNDSAWGVTQWVARSEINGGPRIVSIQNEYSLLYRSHDTDLSEACVNEEITLLAYSPLAAGLLTGKYQHGDVPEGSRLDVAIKTGEGSKLGGRLTDRALAATEAYHMVARKHQLDPVQMAIAFVRHRPFPSIPIIGATTDAQLAAQLDGLELQLSKEVRDDINQVHRDHPQPY